MSKITITRNCKNGEHIFIAGNTQSDGREVFITNWVCRHCLYTAPLTKQWDEFTKNEEPIITEEPLVYDVMVKEDYKAPADTIREAIPKLIKKKKTKGKNRGPKPKPKGVVNGLPSSESI